MKVEMKVPVPRTDTVAMIALKQWTVFEVRDRRESKRITMIIRLAIEKAMNMARPGDTCDHKQRGHTQMWGDNKNQ